MTTLRFQVLGPVAVFHGGEIRTPNSLKQRTLIALLLLHANQMLSAERIIDELWCARPPRSAMSALHTYVSAVRRILSDAEPGVHGRRHPVLETWPNGYVMRVASEQLDLSDFRAQTDLGRLELGVGNCELAGECFRRALGMWRGSALADLAGTGMLEHYVAPLEEERLSVIQRCIGVDLCQRRELEIIGSLTELCGRYPFREVFTQQLMTALCQAGRQTDALDVYRRTYRVMIEQAGIEPGPALRASHQAILEGRIPIDDAHPCVRQGIGT